MNKKKLTKIIDTVGKCFIGITFGIFYVLLILSARAKDIVNPPNFVIYAKQNGILTQHIMSIVNVFSIIAKIGIASLFIGLGIIVANHYNDFKRKK